MSPDRIESLFGILAAVVICFAYLSKKKVTMLFLFAAANLFVGVSLLALGRYDSTILYFLGFAQTGTCAVFALKDRVPPKAVNALFIIAFLSVSSVKLIIDYTSPVDILPLLATAAFAVSFAQKDENKIRFVSFFNLIFWAVYFILVGSTAVYTELVAMVADAYAMIKAKRTNG